MFKKFVGLLLIFSILIMSTMPLMADESDTFFEDNKVIAVKLNDAKHITVEFESVPIYDDINDFLNVVDQNGNKVGYILKQIEYNYNNIEVELDYPLYSPEVYTVKVGNEKYTVNGMPLNAKSVKIVSSSQVRIEFDEELGFNSIPKLEIVGKDGKALVDFADYQTGIDEINPKLLDIFFTKALYMSSGYQLKVLGKTYDIKVDSLQVKNAVLSDARTIRVSFNNDLLNIKSLPVVKIYTSKGKQLIENTDYRFNFDTRQKNDLLVELFTPFYAPNTYTVNVLGKSFKLAGKSLKVTSVTAVDARNIAVQFDKNVTYNDIPDIKVYNKYGKLLSEDFSGDWKIGDYDLLIPELKPNRVIINLIKTFYFYPDAYTVKVFDKTYKVKGVKAKK